MSIKDLFEKYPHFKAYVLPFGIGAIGLVLLIVGIVSVLVQQPKEDISFQDVKAAETNNTPVLKSKEIVVDVAGAVVRPNIYHLSADSRLQDGLIAAGGLSENADRDFVEKHINLAAKLVDGGKLYIPKKGEKNPLANASQSESSSSLTDGSININEASSDQLDALPGIGKVTAQKIITGRPYNDIQDLLTKKIISTKVFNSIKDKVSLY